MPQRRVFDSLMTLSPTAMQELQEEPLQAEEKQKRHNQLNSMIFNSNKHGEQQLK